jgi:hypothetical protein
MSTRSGGFASVTSTQQNIRKSQDTFSSTAQDVHAKLADFKTVGEGGSRLQILASPNDSMAQLFEQSLARKATSHQRSRGSNLTTFRKKTRKLSLSPWISGL